MVQAFESLRLLAEQIALDEATSSCTTEGVHVEVRKGEAFLLFLCTCLLALASRASLFEATP